MLRIYFDFFLFRSSNGNNQIKTFNLSSLNIPEAQYTVLGKLFARDFLFTSIQLNDCNLTNEGKEFLEKNFLRLFLLKLYKYFFMDLCQIQHVKH